MAYTTEQWLVDRALIHDTITAFAIYGDTKQWDKFAKCFPAPRIIRDYSQLFGTPPEEFTPEGLVEARRPVVDNVTHSQHFITGILIHLPPPQPNAAPPTVAKADAYVDVHFTKAGAEGGDHMATGGRYEYELVRLSADELRALVGEGGNMWNPWRVSVMKASPLTFVEGNRTILAPLKP